MLTVIWFSSKPEKNTPSGIKGVRSHNPPLFSGKGYNRTQFGYKGKGGLRKMAEQPTGKWEGDKYIFETKVKSFQFSPGIEEFFVCIPEELPGPSWKRGKRLRITLEELN